MSKKADVLQQKSPAEFFAENKNIAGFDNVRSHTITCLTPQRLLPVLEPSACVNGLLTPLIVCSRESASTRQSGSL